MACRITTARGSVSVKIHKIQDRPLRPKFQRRRRTVFKFLGITLHVRRVESSPTIQMENSNDTTRMALKSFTLGVDSKTVSVDNAVLGSLSKHLLLAMLQSSDFEISTDTDPYVKLNYIRNARERRR